jgi:hypothetical protein
MPTPVFCYLHFGQNEFEFINENSDARQRPLQRLARLAAQGWLVGTVGMSRRTGAKIVSAWRRNLPTVPT